MTSPLTGALVCVGLFCPVDSVLADVLVLNTGSVVQGEIMQESSGNVLVRMDYGTFTYPKTSIKEIHRESETNNTANASIVILEAERLPRWRDVLLQCTKQSWARDIKQIPATVIGVGPLRNVPYVSFHCAYQYELNVYGDLDAPACIEIGLYRAQLMGDAAKSNCVAFIAALLREPRDRAALERLDLRKDATNVDGLTLEITPPSDPDSYGGWWVSVYDQTKLETARASESEIRKIALPHNVASAPISLAEPTPVWTKAELSEARRPLASTPTRVVTTPAAIQSYPPSSGGRVYVRGYFRKDGTYVSAHTRSSPRRR